MDASHLCDLLKNLHTELSKTDQGGFVAIDSDWREDAVMDLEEAIESLQPQSRSE